MSAKSGKDSVVREVETVLTRVDLYEGIKVLADANMNRGTLLPSSQRYKLAGSVGLPRDINDSILFKTGFDTGNKSNKGTLSIVNVQRPQSQENSITFFEYHGKDSRENMRRAGFRSGMALRNQFEALMNRRVIFLVAKVGGRRQSCLVVNSQPALHDFRRPEPIPGISQDAAAESSITVSSSTRRPFKDCVITINFKIIRRVEFIRSEGKTHGFRFTLHSAVDGVVSETAPPAFVSVYFQYPLLGAVPQVEQYLFAGIFINDLDFVSKFLGHQGASAKFLCMFCLATKETIKNSFRIIGLSTDERTIEMMFECGKKYDELMACLPVGHRDRKDKRALITKNDTYSIIGEPLARFPLICVGKATLHIVLGTTMFIVKVVRRGYGRLEELEAEKTEDKSKLPSSTKQSIEANIIFANQYEAKLVERLKSGELSSLMSQLSAEKEQINAMIGRFETFMTTDDAQVTVDRENMSDEQRQGIVEGLEGLRARQASLLQRINDTNAEKLQNDMHLAEQLYILRKMRDEFMAQLKHHEGHASRLIGSVMKANGVDEKVYHNGSIDGNHCGKFGRNGPKIISEVTEGMRKVIKNEANIELLEKLDSVFSRLVKCWHSLMSVMKSVERQTQAAIKQFGNDLQDLLDVFTELADKENEVVPGLDVDIPTFLKSHLLFDHLYAFLLAWETLGGLDEQNIESTHPEFNELIRRFGTTRGARLKALVFQEHLFNRADFQNDVVEAMLSDTSRTKRPNTKPRGEREDGMEAMEQTVDDEDLEMRQLENAMNQNETLRWTPEGVDEFDTSIRVCDRCGKRLIGFGIANHMQEYHSGTITTDRCFNVEQQMLRERRL